MAGVPSNLPIGHEAHAKPCKRCGESAVAWRVIASAYGNGKAWALYNADGTRHACGAVPAVAPSDGPTTVEIDTETADTDRESWTYAYALKGGAARTYTLPDETDDMPRPALVGAASARWSGIRATDYSNDELRAALQNDTRPEPKHAVTVNVSPDSDGGSDAATLAALVQRIAAGAMDEHKVRAIAKDEATRAVAKVRQTPMGLTVSGPDGVIAKVEGLTHYLLPKVVSALYAGCHVFLYGAAGGGKTTVARQAAQAYAASFFQLSFGPDTRGMRLVGYRSPTTGEYVRGPLRDYSVQRSVVLGDELDTAHPSVLPEINALLANGHYTWANDEETEVHPEFRFIAGANTIGRGADGVYMRQPIDGASLDRFVFIEFTYDEALERAIIGAPAKAGLPVAREYKPKTLSESERGAWQDRVSMFRLAVSTSRTRLIVSPRATIYGARLLSAGWSREEVEDAVIWRGASPDDRSRVLAGMR